MYILFIYRIKKLIFFIRLYLAGKRGGKSGKKLKRKLSKQIIYGGRGSGKTKTMYNYIKYKYGEKK